MGLLIIFSDTSSHVIPGLISRLYKAKLNNEKVFEVWGTGKPLREFLYVDDLSDAIKFIITENLNPHLVNVGSGQEVSIMELVELLIDILGFEGEITFNKDLPDGNPRKLLDSSKMAELGWNAKTSLEEGLRATYKWYLSNLA